MTTFKFNLSQKVVLPNGETGIIEGMGIFKNMEIPRVEVAYFDKQGKRNFGWFDEDELTEAEPAEKEEEKEEKKEEEKGE